MFMGEYHHNVDDKSRIVLPSKFRDELGDLFVITRGLDGCLFIYSKEEWQRLVAKLKNLSFTKKDARAFTRFFLSGATELSFDKQGRIAIPGPRYNYASLNKECVLIGVNDRIEIWAKDKFDDYFSTNEDNISDISEALFDNVEV